MSLSYSNIESICIYSGSSNDVSKTYLDAGFRLGQLIGEAGCQLVYGGGNTGLMGATARGAKSSGGKVLGIMPRFLFEHEHHKDNENPCDELLLVDTMHERKTLLAERADAFIALPGGLGTLEELAEILTWGQIGLHGKPICLANIDGYWNPFMAMLNQMKKAGFVHNQDKFKLISADNVEDILPNMVNAAR